MLKYSWGRVPKGLFGMAPLKASKEEPQIIAPLDKKTALSPLLFTRRRLFTIQQKITPPVSGAAPLAPPQKLLPELEPHQTGLSAVLCTWWNALISSKTYQAHLSISITAEQ